MWEFYLAGSETSFRVDGHMVFQIQIAKRQDVVPARETMSASAKPSCGAARARCPFPWPANA